MTRSVALFLTIVSACLTGQRPASAGGEGVDFFERKVRPLLVGHCVACHGPKAQKGGLRLDSREGLLRGGDNGPVVVVGDPDASPLIEAVGYATETKMPPKGRLDEAAIDDLKSWVKMGLPWPEASETRPPAHSERPWALRPIQKPSQPHVSNPDWPRTSIDRFLLAKLDQAGLKPSPPADRRTMIRRWTYGLIGLPPTPEEVSDYELDNSPDADRRVVDRLLISPHYGERWARHWLDLARYADTKGYTLSEDAAYPWAYTYRDYVVRAFNADLPYDRFLLEQLAADRLPLGIDKRPLTALGFLTVGSRFMNNAHDIIDDRIDVTTRGLMGLTVTCARCHDHKFDPIPIADYYALYGVFASSVEPVVPPLFVPPPATDAYRSFEAELTKREAALDEFYAAKYDRLIAATKARAADYLLAAQAARSTPKTDEFMLISDTNDLNPVMIGRWRALLDRSRRENDPVFTVWNALADLPVANFSARAKAALADLDRARKPVNPLIVQSLRSTPPARLEDLAALYGRLLRNADAIARESAERDRLNGTLPRPLPVEGLDDLATVLGGRESPVNPPRTALDTLALVPDRASQATLNALTQAVETWRSGGPGAPPRAMVLLDRSRPIEPRILLRGNASTPGPAVSRHFLSAINPQPFTQGSGRLELAKAIIDRDNPLTARVFVNRVWMVHFGTPLVATPSDFGSRSDPPSHPELLDHLASTFIADGWSIKALHRKLLLSAAYRQSSDDHPEARRVDPSNRLYARMNRRRLDWEATRDFLLATSGQLDPSIGGPSVGDLLGSKSRRRTLYGSIDRLNLYGIYRTFDFPDPNASAPGRVETTVPPQALFFMNHPLMRESALALWKRPDVQAMPSVERRLTRVYEILFGRAPDRHELTILLEYLGPKPVEADWHRSIQALMLGNEFAFID